jgi:superfamily II DNA or RNA helicase
MSYQLRPYQVELLERLNQVRNTGTRSVLLQLPTGGGKTIVFSHVVKTCFQSGDKCLILVHREELARQAVDKIEAIAQIPVGIIKAGYPANYERQIQVASVQSLSRRLQHCGEFGLIVVDECHHSTAKSYRTILSHFPTAFVLGVSATPCRLDGSGFRGVFDELICGVTTRELIDMGSLSKYKYFATETAMSLSGVHKSKGDYKSADVAKANPVEGLAGDVVKSYCDYLGGKQAVVFCINVQHSIAISAHFAAAGISSAHLDGNTPSDERSNIMDRFRSGFVRVMTNCSLFDEGLDIPGLDGVILARPTASLSRFLQMVGRALRPCEGKENAIIIDLAGNWERHGLPDDSRVWSLDGVEKVKRSSNKKLKRKESGEIEEVIIDLTPTGAKFTEIGGVTNLSPELAGWFDFVDRLILEQQLYDRKPASCVYKLLESETKPPMSAWKYLGHKLGYHHGWAKYKFAEWKDPSSTEISVAMSASIEAPILTIEQLWHCVLTQLLPATRDLIKPYGELESIIGDTVTIRMKSATMRSLATGKVPELVKVFSGTLGQTIAIELTVKPREVSA